MTTYRILNARSSTDLGVYDARDEAEALDLMARDAGYRDYAALQAEVPADEGELVVEPWPPTLYKGESIRNKRGARASVGDFLPRVISHTCSVRRSSNADGSSTAVIVSMPLGGTWVADDVDSAEAVDQAVAYLMRHGWRTSQHDAQADAEREAADRAAARQGRREARRAARS